MSESNLDDLGIFFRDAATHSYRVVQVDIGLRQPEGFVGDQVRRVARQKGSPRNDRGEGGIGVIFSLDVGDEGPSRYARLRADMRCGRPLPL